VKNKKSEVTLPEAWYKTLDEVELSLLTCEVMVVSPSKTLGPTFRRARWHFFFATYMMMMTSSTSTPTIVTIGITGHSPAVCTTGGVGGVIVVVTRGEGSSNSVSTSSSVGLCVVDVVSWGSFLPRRRQRHLTVTSLFITAPMHSTTGRTHVMI
jgi:hypothetical protein